MGYASELAARRKRENAEALAKAIDEAARVGKEAFDLARLEALLGRGSQLRREDELRESYFISHPEMRTLAEYAEHLLAIEQGSDRSSRPGEDSTHSSTALASAGVSTGLSAHRAGRSSGVSVSPFQMPCRSGSPHAVLSAVGAAVAAAPGFSEAVGA